MDSISFSLLLESSETPTLDFKLEHYRFAAVEKKENLRKRAKFAKDIICMANTPRNEPAFIVIGAKRRDTGTVERKGVVTHVDDNELQQQVAELIDPKPQFHYHQIQLDGQQFGLIEIPPYQEIGPFMPARTVDEVLVRNVLYWRNGTQNAEASPPVQKRIHAWFRRSSPLMEEIAEAFARDEQCRMHGNSVNGRRLGKLAQDAIEAGDFDAAQEAFLCLIRIAREGGSSILPEANPVTEAERIMRLFIQADWGLTNRLCHALRMLAPFGDSEFLKCDLASHQIPSFFFPAADVLCRIGRFGFPVNSAWAYGEVGKTLAGLLMSASMLLHFQGIPIPAPPEHPWFAMTGRRTIPPEADARTKPFVKAANQIAVMLQPAFEAALKALVYRTGITGIAVDEKNGREGEALCDWMNHWACLPSYAIIEPFNAKSETEAAACRRHLADLRDVGVQTAAAALEFIKRERHLLLTKGDKTPTDWLY